MQINSFSKYETSEAKSLFKKMLLIRRVEETLLDLFTKGKIFGTTHTSIGQEATAVSVMAHIQTEDVVFSNHRCHGHFLAYGGPLECFFAEVMGKATGVSGGRGGSQHLCYKRFFSNGIQGGIASNAVGAGYALRTQNKDGVAVVFLGDGTMGQGSVYESFNFASLWDIPVLFIIENNQYAMSTHHSQAISGRLIDRPRSFGIESNEIDSNDIFELVSTFSDAFSYVRKNRKPFCQIVHNYRLGPHSKGDDFRDPKEIDQWKMKDPLILLSSQIDAFSIEEIESEIRQQIEDAIEKAEIAPVENLTEKRSAYATNFEKFEDNKYPKILNNEKSLNLHSLNKALHKLLAEDQSDEIILYGEDLTDPYGGAFKVTKGLSTQFPKKVRNTPISEATMIGMATGMALMGKKPIVEIMFGDFLSLGTDQILNHASKYHWMYNHQVQVPLVIRTPMGGGRGYGPTHSQSIEKMYIGIPGLLVVAASNIHNPGELLSRAVKECQDPVLFIENKKLYGEYLKTVINERYDDFYVRSTESLFPTIHLSLTNFEQPDMVIITYGGTLDLALSVASNLMIENELVADVIVPSLLSPVPTHELMQCIGDCKTVITIEEGTVRSGWGSEIISEIVTKSKDHSMQRICKKFGAENLPIPTNLQLESKILPNYENIYQSVRELLHV